MCVARNRRRQLRAPRRRVRWRSDLHTRSGLASYEFQRLASAPLETLAKTLALSSFASVESKKLPGPSRCEAPKFGALVNLQVPRVTPASARRRPPSFGRQCPFQVGRFQSATTDPVTVAWRFSPAKECKQFAASSRHRGRSAANTTRVSAMRLASRSPVLTCLTWS